MFQRGQVWRGRARHVAVFMVAAVVANGVATMPPPALAAPVSPEEVPTEEVEPLTVDREQAHMVDAVEDAEAALEAERDASEVPLPAGALDGTAGSDLFAVEDPSVLRPAGDDGVVHPPTSDAPTVEAEVLETEGAEGWAGTAEGEVLDDPTVDEEALANLSPEELTEAVAETSEAVSTEGFAGGLVDRAHGLDVSRYPPGAELKELRTTHSRTFVTGEGTFRTELGTEPMFVEGVDGELTEPDATPVGRRDSRWAPAAGRPGLSFGATARDDQLATMSFGAGRSVSWSLAGAARAPGRRNGRKMSYEGVFDGVDLEMEASPEGVKETIVVHDASAPRSYEFPLDMTGLLASLEDPYGSIVLNDASSGEPVGVIPSGWAEDAAVGPRGETPDPGPVSYDLVGRGADAVLRVTVDEAWFDDPARVFPVRIDPTVADYRMSGDTWVHSRYPTTNRSTSPILKSGGGDGKRRTYFARWDVGWLASAAILEAEYKTLNSYSYSCTPRWFGVYRVTGNWNPSTVTWGSQPGFRGLLGAHNTAKGYNSSCPAGWLQNPMTGVVQKWVDGVYPAYGVTGRVSPNDSYDDSYSYKEFVSSEGGGSGGQILQVVWSPWRARYSVASSLVPPTANSSGSIKIKVTNKAPTTWNATGANRYRLGYHVYKSNGSTLVTWDGGRASLPHDVAWGRSATVNVPIGALPPGNYVLKFDMLREGVRWFSQEGEHPDMVPLSVGVPVGNQPPVITRAQPGGMSETREPTLKVEGTNPDGYPTGGIEYRFKICEDKGMSAGCVQSPWGGKQWVPTHLEWGTTYYWQAAVREKGAGGLTVQPDWKVPLTPTVVQPRSERHFGSDEYAPLHGGVNPSIGNYVASFTDVQVAAAGLPVEIERTYNSMDTRVGAFGPGWSTAIDLVADEESGGRLLVSFPDGRRERYGQNPDGSWATPPGNASVLRSVNTGGWELQRPDRTTYVFDTAGRLASIRDGWGHALLVSRNATTGQPERITNEPSGRYVELDWAGVGPDGKPVVTRASTQPASEGDPPPTWSYDYANGRLVEVCAPAEPEPGSQCTTYAYHTSNQQAGALGKLASITRQEGNVAVEVGYRSDGTVAWVDNGTDDRWTFTDDDAEAEGTYHPVNGWRAADVAQIAAKGTLHVDVTGAGGVPEEGVQAVVANVKVGAYADGWLDAYASGEPAPGVSTMTFAPGIRSNLQTVAVGENGKLALENHSSEVLLVVVDVVGWYAEAGVTGGSVFVPVATDRILDTRVSGQGPKLGANETRGLQVTGTGGVPDEGVRAVVFDLEMVSATTGTDLVAFASDATRPPISTGYTDGGLVDNLQIAAVGPDGKIKIHNAAGSVHVLVDVVGYFADPAVHEGNVYRPVRGHRLLDSRQVDAQWSTPWPANGTRPVVAAGEGLVPGSGVTGVVGDVQAIRPAATNTLRTTPTGASSSGTTYIAQANQNVGNHLYVGLGDGGAFDLWSGGSQDIVVDVVGYFAPLPRTAFVQDPRGHTVEYRYDTVGRLVGRTDEEGHPTAYAYGDDGFLSSVRDGVGQGHVYAHDDDGNLVADTLLRVMGDPLESTIRDWETTTRFGYVDAPDNPAVDGKLAWVSDPRSEDADDTSFRTTYTYDAAGQPLTVRGPGLPAAPDGVGVTKTYADGTTAPAVCAEVAPAGLLQTEADAAGLTTTYCHDPHGDLREVHHPSGLVDRYVYDDLGRAVEHTQVSDTFPSGVTTSRSYDVQGRVVAETAPRTTSAVANPADGPHHQVRTTTTYTPNGNVDRVTLSDVETDDARWVDYDYDASDRVTATVDSTGRATAKTYDPNGNVASTTGVDGARTRYTYDPRNNQRSVIADDVVDDPIDAPGSTREVTLSSRYYDAQGRMSGEIDATGRWVSYRWGPTGNLEHSRVRDHVDTDRDTGLPGGSARTMLVASGQVDDAGNVVRVVAPTNVTLVDDFVGTDLGDAWQTTGGWTVTGGELVAAAPSQAWQEGAVDGQIGITVGAAEPPALVFRMENADNYLRLTWENPTAPGAGALLVASQVVDGVVTEFQGNVTDSAEAGDRIEVAFTGNRLRVFRNGVMAMEQTIPTDTNGTGVGVVATEAGQRADRFRFDAYRRTDTAVDAYGRQISETVDPGGAGLHTERALLPDGRPDAIVRTNTAVPTPVAATRFGYDPMSGTLAWSEDLLADPDPESSGDEVVARTEYGHDQRGQEIWTVSPGGGRVDRAYDEAGRLTSVTGPARTVERHGDDPQPDVRPVESYEYTAFGELLSMEDPAGRSTVYTIDGRGFAIEARLPAYTPPGGDPVTPVVATSFDAAGRSVAETDPLGATTSFTYNTLGLLVAEEQPAAGEDPAGVSRYVYDDAGRLVEHRDPTGAVVRLRRDQHGRTTATEEIVRQPALVSHVSAVSLGDAGGVRRSRTAEGVVSTTTYDRAGRVIATADADGNETTRRYDGHGNLRSVTGPDGRGSSYDYDLVGNKIVERTHGPDGSVLGESRFGWSLDGLLERVSSPRGVVEGYTTTRATYDGAGQVIERVTAVASGVSITESWGYDEIGHPTRYTDGLGNATWQTYNPLGLPEDAIEPAAGAHTAIADRTWRTVYDAAGRAVAQHAPGGVTVTNEYDELGRLVSQAGTGAQAATATRSYDHDLAGRVISAATPADAETFTYDDRGLLLASQGTSGDATFAYDGDGRLVAQTDPSGTMSLTYDGRGLPSTATTSLAGTAAFAYDEAGRATGVDYGDGTTRTFTYDGWGQLDIDRLATDGADLYRVDYGYDLDGNIISKDVTGTDVPAAGTNQYTYDRASRITGWTDPAGTVEPYGWDAASNRTRAGASTAIFDEQNRLVSAEGPGGLTTNTWRADGTLDAQRTQRRVGLVIGDPAAPGTADTLLFWMLGATGHTVTVLDDADPAPSDGVDVVVIAPTVDPAVLADTYKDVSVPVVNLAAATWQDSGLTSGAPSEASSATVHVSQPEHPLAGGRTGDVTVLSAASTIHAVAPEHLGAGAAEVWTRTAASSDVVVAGYDTGSATPGGPAAERRVAIGFSEGAVENLDTTVGWGVIAAAIEWADDNDTEFGTTNFDFDAFEQLSRITTPDGTSAEHSYDGLGRRLSSPTGRLAYAGTNVRPSSDGADRYQHGPTGALAIDDLVDGGGSWAHADAHTDVVGIFGPGDTTLGSPQAFNPWGQPLTAPGLSLGYQSERQDLPGGLVGMGVRAYDPKTATFISHDPATDPLVPNGYSYTPANPLGFTDVRGTGAAPPVIIATGVCAGLTAGTCLALFGSVTCAAIAQCRSAVADGFSRAWDWATGGTIDDTARELAEEYAKQSAWQRGAAAGGMLDAMYDSLIYDWNLSKTQAEDCARYGFGCPDGYPRDRDPTRERPGEDPTGGGGRPPGGGPPCNGCSGPPGAPPAPPKPIWTDPAIIANPPAFPNGPIAEQIAFTGSAIHNYPGRYQNGIDTGIASIPRTVVNPTVDLPDALAAVPEVILSLVGGLASLAGRVGTPSPPNDPRRSQEDAADAADCAYGAGEAANGNADWASSLLGCATNTPAPGTTGSRNAASSTAGASGHNGVETLFHYTDATGQAGIRSSGELRPSLRSVNPRDVRYGEGQYLSDIAPGTRTCAQLSRCFLGQPFQGQRFTHYVEIDVRGLNLVKGRDGVFIVPGTTPLDVTDRLVSWGIN